MNDRKYKISKSRNILLDFIDYANLTIAESRILHSYVSLINPTDTDTATQKIPLEWIRNAFKLRNTVEIEKAVKDYKHNTLTLKSGTTIKIFKTIEPCLSSLGKKSILLECSDEFKKYFFNLNGNYFKYWLNDIVYMKSHKQIVFYEILKNAIDKELYRHEKNDIQTDYNKIQIHLYLSDLICLLGYNSEKVKSYTDIQNNFLINCIKKFNQIGAEIPEAYIKSISYNCNRLEHRVESITFTVSLNEQSNSNNDKIINDDIANTIQNSLGMIIDDATTQIDSKSIDIVDNSIKLINETTVKQYFDISADNQLILKNKAESETALKIIKNFYVYDKDKFNVVMFGNVPFIQNDEIQKHIYLNHFDVTNIIKI